jgi:hypothetical protein
VWWIALAVYLGCVVFAIFWNIFYYWGLKKTFSTTEDSKEHFLLLRTPKNVFYYWGFQRTFSTTEDSQEHFLLLRTPKNIFYYWGLQRTSSVISGVF